MDHGVRHHEITVRGTISGRRRIRMSLKDKESEIRRKLDLDEHIKTIYKNGYRFEE